MSGWTPLRGVGPRSRGSQENSGASRGGGGTARPGAEPRGEQRGGGGGGRREGVGGGSTGSGGRAHGWSDHGLHGSDSNIGGANYRPASSGGGGGGQSWDEQRGARGGSHHGDSGGDTNRGGFINRGATGGGIRGGRGGGGNEFRSSSDGGRGGSGGGRREDWGGSSDYRGGRNDRGNNGGYDSRGGSGGNDRGGDRGGSRGGGGRGGGAKISQPHFLLPLDVNRNMLELATLGWNSAKDLVPPPVLPPGEVFEKTIQIQTNNIRVRIQLPKIIYQYDVDIDLSVDSKERRKAAKARKAAESQPPAHRGERGGGGSSRGRKPPGQASSSQGSGNKDPPKPKLWKKIMKVLIRRLEDSLQRNNKKAIHLASDFSKAIYTTLAIGNESTVVDIPLKDLGDDEDGPDSYTCVITPVAEIHAGRLQALVDDIHKFFTERQVRPQDHAALTTLDRIYSIVFKTLPHYNFTSVGRSSFFSTPTDHGFELSGGLVNWTGFSLIFNMGWKTFINVDVANSAFLKDQTVFEALDSLYIIGWGNNTRQEADPRNIGTMSDRHFEKANKLLKTCQVEYQTRNGGIIRGRVREVCWKIASQHEFTDSSNGRKWNVEQYFQKTYNKTLQNPNGVCLCIKKDSIVPAEFCKITKGQVWNQKLDEAQTATLIKESAKPPTERLTKIRNGIKKLNFSEDAVLKEFGVSVENQLHVLQKARVLPPPTLTYAVSDKAGMQMNLTPKDGDGVWSMWNHPIQFAVPSSTAKRRKVSWGVVNFGDERGRMGCTKENVREFVTYMVKFTHKGGMIGDSVDEVMKIYTELAFNSKKVEPVLTEYVKQNCMFVFVILPRMDTFIYATVKKASEILMQKGILTQCCLAKSITKKGPEATAGNIVLKLNMKLGGTNYVLGMDKKWEKVDILQAPVMIIGADVTHPGLESKYPSLAAVTASCDRTGMPYQMHCQAQKKADKGAAEVIEDLDRIMYKFIVEFIMATGHKPRRILYYRDGVGEGQFGEVRTEAKELVLQKEMMAIRAACNKISGSCILDRCIKDIELGEKCRKYEPGITFLAVQKRHKIRFFVTDPKDGVGKPGNCPPGTVVDTEIVSSSKTNFYLLSHTGIQGTSRPTNYQLLWDDNNFTMDEIQMLTYYLCYMYCRCNRSVSYPAPTYYAHLAATRAKVFTSLCSDNELQDIQTINRRIDRNKEFTTGFPMHFV